MIVKSNDDCMTDAEFHRSFAEILHRDAEVFKGLADCDAGRPTTKKRKILPWRKRIDALVAWLVRKLR